MARSTGWVRTLLAVIYAPWGACPPRGQSSPPRSRAWSPGTCSGVQPARLARLPPRPDHVRPCPRAAADAQVEAHPSPWDGGVQGSTWIGPGAPLGLPLSQDQWRYFVNLGILALLLWMARNWSPAARACFIGAMRDHPIAAPGSRLSTSPQCTALTFAVGAAYAGVVWAHAALLLDFFIAP